MAVTPSYLITHRLSVFLSSALAFALTCATASAGMGGGLRVPRPAACVADFSRLAAPIGSMPELKSGRRMYEEYWPAKAGQKTFVFFHGLGEESGEWDAIAARIRKNTGYGYLRMDFHGHGRSVDAIKSAAHPTTEPFPMLPKNLEEEDAFDRLAAMSVPDRLPFENNVDDSIELIGRHRYSGPLELVGHSYGGGIALAVGRALEDQGRIARIHLLAPYVIRLEQGLMAELKQRFPQWDIPNRVATYFAPQTTQARQQILENAQDFLLDPIVERFMKKSFGEFFQKKVTGNRLRMLSPAEIKWVSVMTDSAIATTKGIRGYKPLVNGSQIPTSIPIHVVAGSDDKLVKRSLLEAFADKASETNDSVKLVTIQGADHMFPIKRPKQTLRAIAPEVYPNMRD